MSNNKATKRNIAPKKKAMNRPNNSSKKTSRVQLEGARQRNSGIGRQQGVAAAYSSSSKTNGPSIRQNRDGCRVTHRELLTSIIGSTNFAVPFRFNLNPGLVESFPWLSTMAPSWEQYKFHSLKFIYLTRTGTSTPGSMMLAPDYDAADAAPISEQIASSYKGVVEDAPWKDITCVLPQKELNSSNGFRYIRIDTLSPNLDIKTYDAGIMNVITLDGTAVNWGKLWIEYDVEFRIPQLNPQGNPPKTAFVASTGNSINQTNPLGVPVIEQTAKEILSSITFPTNQTRLNFLKDGFHGLLTYQGASTIANLFSGVNLNLTPSPGGAVNISEGIYNNNFFGATNNGTNYLYKTLVRIPPDGYLDMAFGTAFANGATGLLTLTPCGL